MALLHSLQITEAELSNYNRCRMYLEAYSLADVMTADGKRLEKWSLYPSKDRRRSRWQWPDTPYPSEYSWVIWRTLLKKAVYIDNKVNFFLGAWNVTPHQVWPNMLSTIQTPTQYIILSPSSTFKEYLSTLPEYQKHFLGDIQLPHDNGRSLYLDRLKGYMIGASDGAYDSTSKLATHAYVIGSTMSEEHIQGMGLTPGDQQLVTPFRAE